MMTPSQEHIETHYEEHKGKDWLPKYVKHIISGPVVCMCWEGLNAISYGRKLLGQTKPCESNPGTIRGNFGLDCMRNICHGSDSF